MTKRPLLPTLALLIPFTIVAPAASGQRSAPCQGDPRSTAFDYWLGTWDVRPFGPGGSGPEAPLHENVIALEQDGCVLREQWRGAAGADGSRYTGTSLTVFDRGRGVWHQTWVDNNGSVALFEGAIDPQGDLVLFALPLQGQAPGGPRRRMSYRRQPDGTIRQVVERSSDNGATWTTGIDLLYTRRPGS
jgi:hypothetical protein